MSGDVTWHPISTAPKDGTKITVVSVEGLVWYQPDIAWWDDESQRFENGEDYESWDLHVLEADSKRTGGQPMTTITQRTPRALRRAATRAASVRADVRSETLPANFEDAYAKLMMASAKSKAFKARNKPTLSARAGHEKPSPMQEKALLALVGVMLSTEVREVMGVENAADALSGLCVKGFVERMGTVARVTKWRRTRKGYRWVEQNRGAASD